jgi:prolipoprotein diacylglyceryltransferase
MFKHGMGFWRTMDLAAPGLALGIVIGRIGDLIIGDHLGKPTDFALGWRCLGSEGQPPSPGSAYLDALNAGNPPSLGCYDLVLHQTALYDFFSTLALLGVLLWFGRRVRNTGFLIIVFACWYGAMRVITDFLRVDRRYLGLTGSQLMSLAVGLACLYLLVRFRGAPPGWRRDMAPPGGPGDGPIAGAPVPAPVPSGAPATESDVERDIGQEPGGPEHSP